MSIIILKSYNKRKVKTLYLFLASRHLGRAIKGSMKEKFKRLLDRVITDEELTEAEDDSQSTGVSLEETLIKKGIPKHEILLSLSGYYNLPYIEFDEEITISQSLLRSLDMERLKKALWCPLSLGKDFAEVAASNPDSPSLLEDVKKTLGVGNVRFVIALPADLVRIIENNQDVNPAFPPSAGRTPLAKVRTYLANRRSQLACYRTFLSKGRTGLAFLRTGFSFVTIALLLIRVFGFGFVIPAAAVLMAAGIAMAVDGLKWYMPARKVGAKRLDCDFSEPTWGTSVLEAKAPAHIPEFSRTAPVEGAEVLRHDWKNLSPVMRRRFLASDRTDMAEERTELACYRTLMAKARTGLAFTRTGFAFTGLGIGLIRQFKAGPWVTLDISLILAGLLMAGEGFYWYFHGRGAGLLGHASVRSAADKSTIWDIFFPPVHKKPDPDDMHYTDLPLKAGQSPGIWSTTGLALERTVLADRRNVMARLRTVMARSRTGMAFIRTGLVICSIGLGLLVYFGAGSIPWTAFDVSMMVSGIVLIADGLYWHLPAEKTRRQFPYCFGGFEITIPDYGTPVREWQKAVFDNDDI